MGPRVSRPVGVEKRISRGAWNTVTHLSRRVVLLSIRSDAPRPSLAQLDVLCNAWRLTVANRWATSTAHPAAAAPLPPRNAPGLTGYNDSKYNDTAERFLIAVGDAVEAGDYSAVRDVAESQGVLTIVTTRGTFVINKQPPLRQLWLSSPISGPWHYDMASESVTPPVPSGPLTDPVDWVDVKDGHSLRRRLTEELSSVIGQRITIK